MTSKNQTTVVITSGTSISSNLNMPPACRAAAIIIPANWTNADIGFNVSADGVTFYPLYQSSGSVYSAKAAASKVTLLPNAWDFYTFPYLQITSLSTNTANAANQTNTVTLTVFFDDAA